MPYPGPWIQGPNFESGIVYPGGRDWHVVPGVPTVGFLDVLVSQPVEYHNFEPGDIPGSISAASDAVPSLTSMPSAIYASGAARWGYYPEPGLMTFVSWLEGYHEFGFRVITMKQPGSPSIDDMPPGVIGIERDGDHILLGVRLAADTVLHSDAVDGSDGGEGNAPSWTTRIHSWAPPPDAPFDDFDRLEAPPAIVLGADTDAIAEVESIGAVNGSDTRTLGFDIDLMPLLGANDRVVLYTMVAEMSSPTGDVTNRFNPGEFSTGYLLSELHVVGTYQQAPYRWIFEGEPAVPYRRITNRKDSLAGGAGRVGGRTKTIQGSNRRGPGAIV